MGVVERVFRKKVEEIDEPFLSSLIGDIDFSEGEMLDYKSKLPFDYDRSKRKPIWNRGKETPDEARFKFAKDVSSFANAAGGVLVYGIHAPRGVARKICGTNTGVEDIEKIKQSMFNFLGSHNTVAPPIGNVNCQPIKVKVDSKDDIVYILEIPKSWRAPHRVSSQNRGGLYTFWSRKSGSADNYQLDVGELREAFNLSETITERIRRFREDRLARVLANQAPIRFNKEHDNEGKVVLHLIPVNAFDPRQRCNLDQIYNDPNSLAPISQVSPYETRTLINLDGILRHLVRESTGLEVSNSYVQLYRNGIIEAACNWGFGSHKWIMIKTFENWLKKAANEYLNILKLLSVELPIYLFLAISGVEGVQLRWSDMAGNDLGRQIDRDVLLLPEVCIQSYEEAANALKDCIVSIWQAGGYLAAKDNI